MESGWDPDVKKFFVQILNSIAMALAWMLACATAGLYFELAYTNGKPVIYTILFYAGAFISLLLLLKYLHNTWKKK
jgi:hypothetical protein